MVLSLANIHIASPYKMQAQRVLIIDDSQDNLAISARLLKRAGYDVITAKKHKLLRDKCEGRQRKGYYRQAHDRKGA